MKKILHFLRSMKFGMILLVLVMLCSLAGSLITQQASHDSYVSEYGEATAAFLIQIGFTDIFHTWYFYVLEALLCLNLVLCSIIRFPKTVKAFSLLLKRAENAQPDQPLQGKEREKLLAFLKERHFRKVSNAKLTDPNLVIYSKNSFGFYGSFLTHLSILVVLLFGSLVLLSPKVTDLTVMPGNTLTLEDGTAIRCESFHINNAEGKLDYASVLTVENADHTQAKTQEIRVNEPLRFGEYKIYQQTYGTAGQVKAYNSTNGSEEVFDLTEACGLMVDDQNGIYYSALYPAYTENEDGTITLITSTSGHYEDPVYIFYLISDGSISSPLMAVPGDEIAVENMTFTFLSPVEFPGLRIKKVSNLLMGVLYFGFALMVIALTLCFFTIPVCIRVEGEGYAIVSPKDQNGLKLDIQAAVTTKEAEK